MNKALFWDFDGTLVFSHHLWSGSLLKTLERYTENNPVTIDEILPHMARGFSWDTPDENAGQLINEKWWEFTNKHISDVYKAVGISHSETERLLPLFRQVITEIENYHPYDDVFNVLDVLSQRGYKHYMVSNNYPELDKTASALGFDKYFEQYIISAQIGFDKPRREIFQGAFNSAGCPDFCCMIGDNPMSDIKGAVDFGIKAILVHNANSKGYNCEICDTLSDILEILP